MTRRMAYLQIIGLKQGLMTTIQCLRREACVQIDRLSDAPDVVLPPLTLPPDLLRHREELGLQFNQLKGMLAVFEAGALPVARPAVEATSLSEALAGIAELLPQIQALTARRDRLVFERDLLPRFEETMRKLLPMFPAAVRDPANVSFGLLVSRAHTEILEVIRGHVSELTDGLAETAVGSVDDATRAMLIVAPREQADALGEMLDRQDVARLRLPPGFDTETPDAAIASLRRRLNSIPDELTSVEHELARIATQWGGMLMAWRDLLEDELASFEVLSFLGETQTSFVLVGWAPADMLPALRSSLQECVGEHVLVDELPITDAVAHRVPVALTNPPPARSFEGLVNLYSTPRYGGIDPTRLMAVFMPLFFGLMLGDLGYGALLAILFVYLRRRSAPGMTRDLLSILMMGAAWSMVFGLVFGEVFGTLGEQLGMHPILFDRADPAHLVDLLVLTASLGTAHILLGLMLGVWDALRHRSRHHLLERGGRLLGLFALLLMVGALVEFLPAGLMTPAVALLVIGLVVLAASFGKTGIVVAPIEMIGLVGNVLSYLRIAAIGLSSVYLALVANEIAGVVGSAVVGVIIAVLLHALNIVLGAFSPTIQSLRLHYVEFFRNFYEGGGRLYEPFRSRILSGK